MGHRPPDAEWFEKGLVALEEPVAPAGGAKVAAAKPTTRPAAVTRPAVAASTQPADPQVIAQQLLVTARLYVDNKQFERGREKLTWIVQHYPGTAAAGEAKKLLANLAAEAH